MRAVVVREHGEPTSPTVEENWPDPVPGPGEILVETKAAAANFVDLLVIGGTYQFLPPRPFVPGKLPAGIVTALGEGVTRFNAGDRVLTMAEQGGYAQKVAVSEKLCYALPEAMSFTEAAAFSLAYDTAWFALRERGRFQPGETVLVLGSTGAVGIAAVQIAHALGAKVLAGVSTPAKADQVKEAGADAIIDLSQPDLKESLRAQVYAATGGKGADIVLDPLGGDIFDAALRALAWRGRLVVIGFAAGRIPSVKANYILVKNIEVTGLQISDYRKRMPAMLDECFRELFELYEAGKLKVPTPTTYPLQGFGQALTDIRDRKVRGRAVLLPG